MERLLAKRLNRRDLQGLTLYCSGSGNDCRKEELFGLIVNVMRWDLVCVNQLL